MTARKILLASFTLALFATVAEARPRPGGHLGGRRFEANKTFGLGLELGEPTALCLKYFISGDHALDFGIGSIYSHFDRYGFEIYGDYLLHPVSLVSNETFELPFYVGIGARILDFEDRGTPPPYDSAFAVGLRVPLGLTFDFNNVPIDVFIQIVPVLDFYTGYRHVVFPFLDASVGVRYWFN